MNDRFRRSKEFSDFVGFHFRALLCLTMVFVAILPSIDDFFQSLKWQDPSLLSRSWAEYIVQLGAVTFFGILLTILAINIFKAINDYFSDRYGQNRAFRFSAVTGCALLELCAAAAFSYFVFFRLSTVLNVTDADRDELHLRQCLIDELWSQNRAPITLSADCVEKLKTLRNTKGLSG